IGLKTAVREQAMIAEANADSARKPPEHQQEHNRLPGEEEDRADRGDVHGAHEDRDRPIDAVRPWTFAGRSMLGNRRMIRIDRLVVGDGWGIYRGPSGLRT